MNTLIPLLHDFLPPPRTEKEGFCTEAFLHAYNTAVQQGDTKETMGVLSALSRKIEVGRALCVYYRQDLQGKSVDGQLVAPEYMPLACAVMLHAAELWNSAVFLNCAVKMLDGVATPQAEYHELLREKALALLAQPLARWRV